MDTGPRRSQSRSVINRSSDSRSESVERQPETVPPVTTPPQTPPPSRSYSARHKQPEPGFFKRNITAMIIVAVLVIVVVVGGCFYYKSHGVTAIESGKYQAVFFTNGQVYFGKLKNLNADYMSLTDVYYLQSDSSKDESSSENPQSSDSDQSSMQLVKLGKEIHGPEDKMVISKDQVLFYENLKKDGKVAESIARYQQGQ